MIINVLKCICIYIYIYESQCFVGPLIYMCIYIYMWTIARIPIAGWMTIDRIPRFDPSTYTKNNLLKPSRGSPPVMSVGLVSTIN